MRELNLQEIENVSGGEIGPDGRLPTVTVPGQRIYQDPWTVSIDIDTIRNSGMTVGEYIFGPDYGQLIGEDTDRAWDAVGEGFDPNASDTCPDGAVGYVLTGVGSDFFLDVSLVRVETSDNRTFLVVGGGAALGLPGVELGAGWAVDSDVFEGFGGQTGAVLNTALSVNLEDGAAFGVADGAGTTVTYGWETTGAETYPGVISSDGFAFGPLVPPETNSVPEPTHCPNGG